MAETYVLHSLVRRVQTRTQRVMNPGKARFVQKIGGGEIILRRGRRVQLPPPLFKKHLAEIKDRASKGLLEVRTLTGEPVNLDTLKAESPKTVSKPKPAPLADSVARDKPKAATKPEEPKFPLEVGVEEEEPPGLTGFSLAEAIPMVESETDVELLRSWAEEDNRKGLLAAVDRRLEELEDE